MKYYGINKKHARENYMYRFAKLQTKVKSTFPGKIGKRWKLYYDNLFDETSWTIHHENAVPTGKHVILDHFVTSDLVFREDVEKLHKGLKWLLLHHYPYGEFVSQPIQSVEEMDNKISEIDKDMSLWHSWNFIGLFDFHGSKLQDSIDHFSLGIRSINTSFFALEFTIYLTDEKKNKLSETIKKDINRKKYSVHKVISRRKNKRLTYQYAIGWESDESTKSQEINNAISSLEWDFYEAMKHLPLFFHRNNIQPPRIDVFLTDIDYHEDHFWFWKSVGINRTSGQFIDENHKVFFPSEWRGNNNRLLYVVRDDVQLSGDEWSRYTIMDQVYGHLQEFAGEYFKFLFLRLFFTSVKDNIAKYKRKLDRLKLRKRKFRVILKLRYKFEKETDAFKRYSRENIWQGSIDHLRELYKDNDELIKKIKFNVHYLTCNKFCDRTCSVMQRLSDRISEIETDFEDKRVILQHLVEYKNSRKSWILSILMFVIAASTLLFVIFPDDAVSLSNWIRNSFIVQWIEELLK